MSAHRQTHLYARTMPTASNDRYRRLWIGTTLLALGLVACGTAPTAAPDFVAPIRAAAPAVLGVGDGQVVLGSGFRVAGRPWVVTAAHVVRGLRGTPVLTWSYQSVDARVLHIDDETDLALLALDENSPIPGLRLSDAAPPPVGQWIIVLGCPFGGGPTASVGVVSALPGTIQQPAALRQRMQLNAAINAGNSGGPVVNLDGRVIGVASATVPGGFGIGFAVPVSALRDLMTQALDAP